MELTDSSSIEGSINSSNEAKSITLKLSKNSKIKLTGDSYVTSLDDEDTSYKNIDFNGYKLYVNGKKCKLGRELFTFFSFYDKLQMVMI